MEVQYRKKSANEAKETALKQNLSSEKIIESQPNNELFGKEKSFAKPFRANYRNAAGFDKCVFGAS